MERKRSQKFRKEHQAEQREDEWAVFPNHTQTGRLEERYHGAEWRENYASRKENGILKAFLQRSFYDLAM
jgi:hypothetical protein